MSLVTRGAGATRVVGGTPAMRARARSILDGMGDVAITAVRFRHANGAMWLSTTVAGAGSPFADGLRSQLAADGPLWEASVFNSAYRASQPAGQPAVHGTSEAFSIAGRVHRFSSESGPADPYRGPAEPDSAVRSVIAQAAARGRFRVVSISLMHPNRQAATVVVRADRRASFARGYRAFLTALSRLTGRLDGLQSQVVDRCGYPVAIASAGDWISPRWLCPNPFVPGIQMSRAMCRKLPRGFPACG
ncbi:MAG: hypothetical protein ACRDQC_06165 [Gaiellales bacterium]